jgi:branched-chain amino acid transport system substrate-binding protein
MARLHRRGPARDRRAAGRRRHHRRRRRQRHRRGRLASRPGSCRRSSAPARRPRCRCARSARILIGATGTPAALPHITLLERGYAGKLYHTHGVVNDDFLRVGGKKVEKAYAPIGPVVVWKDLPDSNPVKKVSADFIALWNTAHAPGPVNAFATWAYDAFLMLQAAASTEAVKKTRAGTPEYRVALRHALENNTAGLVGANGVYNVTRADHNGLDKRARVMVQVVDADWRLAK